MCVVKGKSNLQRAIPSLSSKQNHHSVPKKTAEPPKASISDPRRKGKDARAPKKHSRGLALGQVRLEAPGEKLVHLSFGAVRIRVERLAGDPSLLEDRLHILGKLRIDTLQTAELHHLVKDVMSELVEARALVCHLEELDDARPVRKEVRPTVGAVDSPLSFWVTGGLLFTEALFCSLSVTGGVASESVAPGRP